MIDFLRLMSIFGGLGSGSGMGGGGGYNTPPINSGPSGTMPTFGGSYQDFQDPNPYQQPQPYQPTRTMQDRFMELMQSFPERENPSGWRKVGAFLTGLGGENASEAFQLSHQVANMPHMMKMQDWGAQVKPVMEAAENERLYNQYEQTNRLNQQKANELEAYRRDQLERQTKRDETLGEQGDRRLQISQQAQILREWKAANPGWEYVNDTSTGKVVAINKADPSQVRQTGVNHGDLSDTLKLQIGLDMSKDLASFRGEIESRLIGQRQANTLEAINLREELIRARPVRPGSTGGTSELEIERALDNTLRQMFMDKPEWQGYVQNGVIKAGTPVETAEEIRTYLRTPREPIVAPRRGSVTPVASGVPFNKPGEANQPPPQQRPVNRPAPPDTPRVRTDGKVFVWDNETGQYGYVLRDAVTKAKTADGKMRFEVIR